MQDYESYNPYMIMMIGLPASGKSTVAKYLDVEDGYVFANDKENASGNFVIHSSDDLRAEMFGDAERQGNNNELFNELHCRIRQDLKAGKNVIYDATNINKRQRASFLESLDRIDCTRSCVAVMTPYEVCVRNNAKRSRRVPEHVIRRMYMNWQPPHYHEGFDSVNLFFLDDFASDYSKYNLDSLAEAMRKFNQENSHHTLSLGGHSRKALAYCEKADPNNFKLQMAAYLHDIGKLETKTRKNYKGVEDGECHYYQHHCVGAYLSALYIAELGTLTFDEKLDVMNLIYFHMHPYNAWKQSQKAENRDKEMIGETMFNEISLLHQADLFAH